MAVHCPSDVTYGSWNLDWEDDRCWLEKIPQNPPRGQHPGPESVWNSKCGLDPRTLPENMQAAWKWNGKEISRGIRIQVENIDVPTFISHGVNDDVWHVKKSQNIQGAMKAAGREPEVHYFENQGHNLQGDAATKRGDLMFEFLKRTVG